MPLAAKSFSRKPILPSTTVSRLLKSWATPEVSCPTASSRCIWRSVVSTRSRSAIWPSSWRLAAPSSCGALLHPRFELLVEPLAFVLPAAAAQAGLHDAHQGGRMERALEESDVAELRGQLRGRRIALEAAPVRGQAE